MLLALGAELPGAGSEEETRKEIREREWRESWSGGELKITWVVGGEPLHVRASVKKLIAGREGHGRLQIQHRGQHLA